MFSKTLIFLDQYLIIFILIFAASLLSININKPFIGLHDFNAAQAGNAAKNYLKFGLVETKLGQITGQTSGPIDKKTPFYLSYLPFTSLLVYVSFLVFGVTEWAARLVPITFSLLGLFYFYLITKRIWNKNIALLASIFYILNPMFLYFGKMPVFEILILGASLPSFYYYLNWLDKKDNKNFLFFCLFLFLAGLAGWPIIYFAPLLVVHSLLINRFEKKLLISWLIIGITVLFLFLHSLILTGSFFNSWLIQNLNRRLNEGNLSFGGVEFNLLNYLKQEFSWLQAYYSKTMLVFSLIGTFFTSFKLIKGLKFDLKTATIFFWLFFGLGHPILFSRMIFIHEYLNIYLLPFFALSAGIFLHTIFEIIKRQRLNSVVASLIALLILVTYSLERTDFTKALIETKLNQPGKDMAVLFNNLNTEDNKIALISPRFESFYGIFTQFYSDSSYAILSEEDLKKVNLKVYNYLIFIDQDVTDIKNYQELITKYQFEKKKDITIIKTK